VLADKRAGAQHHCRLTRCDFLNSVENSESLLPPALAAGSGFDRMGSYHPVPW
jgi:hypothetical protein